MFTRNCEKVNTISVLPILPIGEWRAHIHSADMVSDITFHDFSKKHEDNTSLLVSYWDI